MLAEAVDLLNVNVRLQEVFFQGNVTAFSGFGSDCPAFIRRHIIMSVSLTLYSVQLFVPYFLYSCSKRRDNVRVFLVFIL